VVAITTAGTLETPLLLRLADLLDADDYASQR